MPTKVTSEGEQNELKRAACDLIIQRAIRMMTEEVGASLPMALDRIMTFAAAQAASVDGSPATADNFRLFAKRIEDGIFHPITGEDLRSRGSSH